MAVTVRRTTLELVADQVFGEPQERVMQAVLYGLKDLKIPLFTPNYMV